MNYFRNFVVPERKKELTNFTKIQKLKKHPLTKSDKANNSKISSKRIQNKYAIVFVKCFRILFEKYRNRRKRFVFRYNLISAVCNYELLS